MRNRFFYPFSRLAFVGLSAAGVVALTAWQMAAPSLPIATITADTVAAPANTTVQVCTSAPENTLGGIDITPAVTSTSINATDPSATVYADATQITASSTVLPQADGVTLTTAPVDGNSASSASIVASLSRSGDLRALTTAPCMQPGSLAWIVGGDASVGSSAQLRLTNPGTTPVTAHVTLYGATGPLALPSNGDIAIAAGKTGTLLLETASEASERIAVRIETDGGQVAAFLVTEKLDGETPAGSEILTSNAIPSKTLLIPGVLLTTASEQGQSDAATQRTATSADSPVVRIVNPNERETKVSIYSIGPDGQTPLAGATNLPIDAGAVFDVALDGIPAGAYGIRVVADQPVTAAAQLVRSAGEYPAKSGHIVQDQTWIGAASGGMLRSGYLALPQLAGVKTKLLITNGSRSEQTITLTALERDWDKTITVAAQTTQMIDLPQVSAISLTGATSDDLVAAGVASSNLDSKNGSIAGTLVSAIPLTPNASNANELRVNLH